MVSWGWQRAARRSRHPVVPASLEPGSPSSPPAALASLLRTRHCPDGSCSEQLPGAVAEVLEPSVPQIMSPAPGPQPAHWWHLWAVLASQAPACAPWHPEVGHGSSTLQWHWGRAGWSRTRVVPGTLSGSRAVGRRCPWGTSTVPLRQRGPQIPLAQPSSFSQRREPCRAAREPLSSRLSPGGGLCSWAEVPHVLLALLSVAEPARAGGC